MTDSVFFESSTVIRASETFSSGLSRGLCWWEENTRGTKVYLHLCGNSLKALITHGWSLIRFLLDNTVLKNIPDIWDVHLCQSFTHKYVFSQLPRIWRATFQLSFRASQRLSCDAAWIFPPQMLPKMFSGGEVLWLADGRPCKRTLVAVSWTLNRFGWALMHVYG